MDTNTYIDYIIWETDQMCSIQILWVDYMPSV